MDYKADWDPKTGQTVGLEDLEKQLQNAMLDIVKRQYDTQRKLNWIEQELSLAKSFCTR